MDQHPGFDFDLPGGYMDGSGVIHRQGTMRPATAMDEITVMQDPRLAANDAYLPVLLLSRVVTRLGSLPAITPKVIENLYASDLAYLEDLYIKINRPAGVKIDTICPHCGVYYQVQLSRPER